MYKFGRQLVEINLIIQKQVKIHQIKNWLGCFHLHPLPGLYTEPTGGLLTLGWIFSPSIILKSPLINMTLTDFEKKKNVINLIIGIQDFQDLLDLWTIFHWERFLKINNHQSEMKQTPILSNLYFQWYIIIGEVHIFFLNDQVYFYKLPTKLVHLSLTWKMAESWWSYINIQILCSFWIIKIAS
jgi:hypothetical protein